MITVRAEQLIYSRVEPPFSPVGKDGFQTVYRSDPLSPADVSAIENRIQCFLPELPESIRYQFFTLENGAVVLTGTTAIASHPDIVDKNRRKGAFIAHALVISPKEFQKVENDPFAIMDAFSFLNDAEVMVRNFGQATGVAPHVEIDVNHSGGVPSSAWAGAEVKKLIALGLQAEKLVKTGRSVLFPGKGGEIEEALRTCLFLIPPDKRLDCSFDTCADRCPVRHGLYWAIGMPARKGGNYVEADAAGRRVAHSPDGGMPTDDLYLAWLDNAVMQMDLPALMHKARTMQQLSHAFGNRIRPSLDELDKDSCREFMELYKAVAVRSLEDTVAGMIGKNGAGPLVAHLCRVMENRSLLAGAAAQSMDPAQLSDAAADWIAETAPTLKDGDYKAFEKLARAGDNMRLLHLSACLRKKPDEKIRDEALSRMDESTFRKALDALMNPIEPADFVTPARLDALLSDERLSSVDDEGFVELVKAVIEARGAGRLIPFAERVRGVVTHKALANLEKIVKAHDHVVPLQFKEALAMRRNELGKSSGFLGFFRK